MNEIQEKLREKYNIHPILFLRSVERARTDGELFDFLHAMPDDFPVVWNEELRVWNTTNNLLQFQDDIQMDHS